MSLPNSPRCLALLLLACGLAGLGCDKLLQRGEDAPAEADGDAKEDDTRDAPVDAKTEVTKSDASETSEVKEDEDPEALAKRKAEEEAKRQEEEDAKKPLALFDVAFEGFSGSFGGGTLRITGKGKVNQTIAPSSYVHAKILCRDGERVLADTGYVNTGFQKQLDQHAIGEVADLQGSLFTQGTGSAPSPCEVEFRLGGPGGGVSIHLATLCWDGHSTSRGSCDPPVASAAMSATGTAFEIHGLKLDKDRSFGNAGLQARYIAQVNTPPDPNTRLTLKATCEIGKTRFVDVGIATLSAGPFRYETGESIVRTAKLFWNTPFGFSEPPDLCDVSVSSWSSKPGTFGDQDETVLESSCYRNGEITDGPCDPARPAPPPATAIEDDSLELDDVIMQIDEPWGSSGDRFQLKLQLDATVHKSLPQRTSIKGKLTCKVGRTARVETAYAYGVELHYLHPSETTRLTAMAFTSNSMEQRPGSCEAHFTAGEMFNRDQGVDLGRWCLKKDKVKKGKC